MYETLNSLSIVFYRSHSPYTQRTKPWQTWMAPQSYFIILTVHTRDVRNHNRLPPVWGSLRLAPITHHWISGTIGESSRQNSLKVKRYHPNLKFLYSGCHFFTCMLIDNSQNLAILAPINFCQTPFYLSHAYNLGSIEKNHVTQNGCHLQILSVDNIGKTQDTKFIASCQVSSSIHKNIFTKRKVIS